MTFDELSQLLSSFDTKSFGKGATDVEIESAERRLGVPLKGGYRLFLRMFGWGGVGHIEIYGLGADVQKFLDLVHVTESERTEMRPRLPEHLVPVMNDGAGNLYCLDTRANEPPVVLWNHDAGEDQQPTVEGESFAEWLSDLVTSLE